MAQISEQKLLQAIEKDDIKTFNALMEEARCGSYRLGRFPVLSLMYLYSSRKLLAAYEEKFLKIPSWEELREPAELSKRFLKAAGKCLRLYFSEVVTPLEMLLILDRDKHAKKIYPHVKPSEAVKERMRSIYAIKYALGIQFKGNQLLLDRRPLTRRERKRFAALCVGCAAAFAIIVTVPTTTAVLFAPRAGGDVTRLSHIKFNAQTTYTLQRDIVLPKNFSAEEVNCTIIGNGHKLIFQENATLGEVNGKMSDLEIQTSGSPVITYFMPNAELTNVTVNVNANLTVNGHSALFVLANYGTLDGVIMNVSGSYSATSEGMDASTEELVFGGLVLENMFYSQRIYGTVQNCTVNYSDFSLFGELKTNATFGGLVGVNHSVVQDCTVTGKITADTFDLAGACYANYSKLSRIVNEADLQQVACTQEWYPTVGGIVIENASTAEYCQNLGNITVEGLSTAICGGIAARTYGQINYCVARGDISVTAHDAYIGCIFGRSEVKFSGISLYCGFADNCIGSGKIAAALQEGESCVGGIGGFVQEGVKNNYLRDEKGNVLFDENGEPIVESVEYVGGGGVRNCFFLGECEGEFNYFGSIVGVCGEDIYDRNSYTSGKDQLANFEGNYYLGTAPSFGRVVSTEGEYSEVNDKGASAATGDEIINHETYREILKKLGLESLQHSGGKG